MLPKPATDFYALQQRVSKTARNEIRRAWRRMGDNFDASWRQVAPVVLVNLTAAQQTVAEESLPYLAALTAATDLSTQSVGELIPDSLVGIASDGRSLDTLAYGAVVTAGKAFNRGATKTAALKAGGLWLDLMAKTQIADAARVATGVGMQVHPGWGGYVRLINPPCCQNCAVLAGRVYKHSTGFDRHGKCDCIMVPVKNRRWAEAEGFVSDPIEAFEKGWITDLSDGQINAIRDGADISQVVNSRRGKMTTTTIKGVQFDFTLEGTTKRGIYGGYTNHGSGFTIERVGKYGYIKNQAVRRAKRSRLTPETIYRVAKDRDDAIRLLRNYGYIHPFTTRTGGRYVP